MSRYKYKEKDKYKRAFHPPETTSTTQTKDTLSVIQKAQYNSSTLTSDDLSNLHLSLGNQGVGKLIGSQQNNNVANIQNIVDRESSRPIMPKLKVGAPGDKFEQEADHVAENIADGPFSSNIGQRITSIQGKQSAAVGDVTPEIESSINHQRGKGRSLGIQRSSMESSLGADFSGVRVHTDSHSDTLNQSLGSRAFTTGQDIFFGKNQYTNNATGKGLLAHELTHVVQQNNGLQHKTEGTQSGSETNSIQRMVVSTQEFKKGTKLSATGRLKKAFSLRGLRRNESLAYIDDRLAEYHKTMKSLGVNSDKVNDGIDQLQDLDTITQFENIFEEISTEIDEWRKTDKDRNSGQDKTVNKLEDEVEEEQQTLKVQQKNVERTEQLKQDKKIETSEKVEDLHLPPKLADYLMDYVYILKEKDIDDWTDVDAIEEYDTAHAALIAVTKAKGVFNNWLKTHLSDGFITINHYSVQKIYDGLGYLQIKLIKIRQSLAPEEKKDIKNVAEDLQSQKTEKGIEPKKYKGNINGFFRLLGWTVEKLAPYPGEVANFKLGVEIPVDDKGVGFLGFDAAVTAERTLDNQVRATLKLGGSGGFKIPGGIKLKAQIGGYLDARAESGAKVFQLMSYALYRKFRGSRGIPRDVASFIWGGGKSGKTGFMRSEKFAAKIEKEIFKDKKAYIDSGLYTALALKGKLGDDKALSAEGGVEAILAKRYSKASIERAKKELGVKEDYSKRGKKKSRSEGLGIFKASASLSGGPLKGGVSGKLTVSALSERVQQSLQENQGEKKGKKALDTLNAIAGSFKTELNAFGQLSIPIPGLPDALNTAMPIMVQGITNVIRTLRGTINGNMAEGMGTSAFDSVGSGVNHGAQSLVKNHQSAIQEGLSKKFGYAMDSAKKLGPKASAKQPAAVKLVFGINSDLSKPSITGVFKIVSIKGFKADFEIVNLSISKNTNLMTSKMTVSGNPLKGTPNFAWTLNFGSVKFTPVDTSKKKEEEEKKK